MTKLEELTELLVNEINEFNKGIEKLQKINEQLNITKIKMDISEYKAIIESHQQKMNEQINTQERFESRFERLLKTAKVYPNWAVIVFIISILLSIASIVYAYKVKKDIVKSQNQIPQQNTVTFKTYAQTFFESNPKSIQVFEKLEDKRN
jgi:hypothetical protein